MKGKNELKYFVTGATGFLGPYLIKRITSDGQKCRCLVRSNSNTAGIEYPGVEIVQGDITKPETLAGTMDDCDILIHMATLGHMSIFTVTPEMFDTINVKGTLNVMDEALRSGIKKIVHCSTVAAMGICNDIPATEESRCNPHHSYGRSKREAEKKVLKMAAESGLPASIVRFSMIYGPGDPRDILKLARLAQKNLFPKIGAKPKLTPLIHAEDAVTGLLLAAEKGKKGEIYLITNPQSEPFDSIRIALEKGLGITRFPLYVPEWLALALADLCETIFTWIGKPPPVARKNIESTIADRVFSTDKAGNELGFTCKIAPEAGLIETAKWYKEKGWV